MVICVLFYGHDVFANVFGPRENPEKYPDYGGTPDLVLSGDVGLSDQELSELLDRLSSNDLQVRIEAATQIKKNAAGCEAVFRRALWKVGFVRHTEVKAVLKKASAGSEEGNAGAVVSGLIQMDPSDSAVALAAKVTVMLVALHSLDTMAGYKVMLDFSGRHAGAFRAFIGDLLVRTGLKVLPALIYGRGSSDEELHMFSVAWIRDMGNPLLSEQIQGIRNSRRLAQLLEAYASVNELDAIDVTLSCANHESAFVRNAARAALKVYGKNAKWSIHREYENNFEDEPADSTDYDEWAEALFQLWDEQREQKTQQLFADGLAAAKTGNYSKMDAAFRKLLAKVPLFANRAQMAEGYLKYAAFLETEGKHGDAVKVNRMAKRLADEGDAAYSTAGARLEWLSAESNRESGGLDVKGYRKLASHPATRDAAKKWASYGAEGSSDSGIPWWKVIAVSLLIFASAILILVRVKIS